MKCEGVPAFSWVAQEQSMCVSLCKKLREGEGVREREREGERERERRGVSENNCLFERMLKCRRVEVYVLFELVLKQQKLKKRKGKSLVLNTLKDNIWI